jgi:t-SNARE complex subunit (syntaxin)
MITPNNEAQQTNLAATMMIVEEGVMVSLGVRQISENFSERKTEILDITKSLTEVKTETQNENAQECYKSLRGLLKRLQDQESSLKKPLNDARSRITKIVSDASVDIEREMFRLKSMIGEFSEEKIRERQRIVDEIEKEKKRVDMERNALIEEMNRLSKAGDTKGVDSVLDDLAFVQTPLPIEVPSVSSVCGKIVRDFKVLNEGNKWKEHTDMLAFVAFAFAHPEIPLKGMIKIEIKRQDFLEALKDKDFLPNGADGIEIFERISTTIR